MLLRIIRNTGTTRERLPTRVSSKGRSKVCGKVMGTCGVKVRGLVRLMTAVRRSTALLLKN